MPNPSLRASSMSDRSMACLVCSSRGDGPHFWSPTEFKGTDCSLEAFVVEIPHPYCSLALVVVESVINWTRKLHVRAGARQRAYLNQTMNLNDLTGHY